MRSHNDWAALKKAELLGHEEPGTYARLRAEHEAALLEKKAEEARKVHADLAKVVRDEPKTWGKKWAPK